MNATVKKINKVYASEAQINYLLEGLSHREGKLPLFDETGNPICKSTVNAVVEKGWAEPAYAKSFLKGLAILRLTDKGREVVMGLSAA